MYMNKKKIVKLLKKEREKTVVRIVCFVQVKHTSSWVDRNAVDRMFTCDILPPKKCSKQKFKRWTNNPFTLRSNVTVN